MGPFEIRATVREGGEDVSQSGGARLGDEDGCCRDRTRFMNTLVVISSFFSFWSRQGGMAGQ